MRGSRLSTRRLQETAAGLSDRDRDVLYSLRTVRVLTGAQLERLHFADVAGTARGRIRRRVLARLVGLGLVQTLERRVGGVRAGSAGLVYALTAGGQRLLDLEAASGRRGRDASLPDNPRRRGATTPGALFLAHSLAVSEIYVGLHEAARFRSGLHVGFAAEQDARWPVESGDVLRPDALVRLSLGNVEDVWWLEVDRGTESYPRLRGMLARYLDFASSGALGPGGVVPRVLVSAESDERVARLRGLIRRLPEPAAELFVACRESSAVRVMVRELIGSRIEEPP